MAVVTRCNPVEVVVVAAAGGIGHCRACIVAVLVPVAVVLGCLALYFVYMVAASADELGFFRLSVLDFMAMIAIKISISAQIMLMLAVF
jgi:hypothetical protein